MSYNQPHYLEAQKKPTLGPPHQKKDGDHLHLKLMVSAPLNLHRITHYIIISNTFNISAKKNATLW